jgi:hypothetical protein
MRKSVRSYSRCTPRAVGRAVTAGRAVSSCAEEGPHKAEHFLPADAAQIARTADWPMARRAGGQKMLCFR